jgi:hypothetical protein
MKVGDKIIIKDSRYVDHISSGITYHPPRGWEDTIKEIIQPDAFYIRLENWFVGILRNNGHIWCIKSSSFL